MIGIGGGGDVVGALAAAGIAERLGTRAELGGLTWERRPVDPLPGPRTIDELTGATRLHAASALAGPETSGPAGFLFAESRMAAILGRPTVLIDPNGGPAAAAGGVLAAAAHLACDAIVLLDVGGDVLAHGDEAGLASPLADAVLLAAAPAIARGGAAVLGAVFGAGCDGELTPTEVLERVAEVRDAGGWRGTDDLDQDIIVRLEQAVAQVPTEASAMATRCARGETGHAEIRGGRRSVELTADGGRVHWFDPGIAIASAARAAHAVRNARDLLHADSILASLGIRTELAFERDAASR